VLQYIDVVAVVNSSASSCIFENGQHIVEKSEGVVGIFQKAAVTVLKNQKSRTAHHEKDKKEKYLGLKETEWEWMWSFGSFYSPVHWNGCSVWLICCDKSFALSKPHPLLTVHH
jgi:hypothetical protein